MPKHEIEKMPYWHCNRLTVSGGTVRIANLHEAEGDSIAIQMEDMYEPLFISSNEARLVIAALQVAIDHDEGR